MFANDGVLSMSNVGDSAKFCCQGYHPRNDHIHVNDEQTVTAITIPNQFTPKLPTPSADPFAVSTTSITPHVNCVP